MHSGSNHFPTGLLLQQAQPGFYTTMHAMSGYTGWLSAGRNDYIGGTTVDTPSP
jgi:hypothetical protein